MHVICDDLVKSPKTVTSAGAGVQNSLNLLDSRFRGNDKMEKLRLFTNSSYVTVLFFQNPGILIYHPPQVVKSLFDFNSRQPFLL